MADKYKFSKQAASYIAGIVDGEGYIGITKYKAASQNFVYRAQLEIGMCDPQALTYIAKETKIKVLKIKRTDSVRKSIYRIRLSGPRAIYFLEQIQSFLKVKRVQADLCTKLQVSIEKREKPVKDKRGLHKTVVSYREKLWKRCCHLNSGT